METLHNGILNKLSGLLYFLKRSNNEFEMVADEIENPSLKTALNGLSEESNFYAGEIKDYLKYLGINAPSVPYKELSDTDCETVSLQQSSDYGNELNCICNYNEMQLTNAYSNLLKESLPFENLKNIIIYQLKALKYSFLKIKTLNTARFAIY